MYIRACEGVRIHGAPGHGTEGSPGEGKTEGVVEPGEKLFWTAFTAAKESKRAFERMENFLNLYGFARNIALVAFLDAALLGYSHNFDGGPPRHGNLALLCLRAGIETTFRYLKFVVHYAVEVFTSYAYAKGDREAE